MNDKEKYGIELEAETSLFKRKMQELSSYIRKFGKEAEKETTIQPKIDPSVPKKELLRWKEVLENDIKEAQESMQMFKGTATEEDYQDDINRYTKGLELVNNRLKEIEKSESEIDDGVEEINNETSKSTLGELFDKSIGKIKRFTYYLLGARSVFSLFMKYQSIYYQYNEQMQYQSELSQNAIALSLAPAFEFLGNVVTYASIGIAKFIELLTGVNVLSKVTTKGIRDYNKSLKETQTLVSGIDEITNLTMPSGTGLASQYAALDDFQKKIAEVEEFFKQNEWINKVAEFLKLAWEYTNDKILPAVVNISKKIFEVGSWLFNNVIKPVSAFLYGTYEFIKFIIKGVIDVLSGNMDQFDIDLENFKNNVKGIFYWFKSYSMEEEKVFSEYLEKMKDVANNGGDFKLELNYEDVEKFYEYLENSQGELESIKGKIDVTQEIDENGKVFLTFKQNTIKDLDEIDKTIDETFKDRDTKVNFDVNVNTKNAEKALSSLFDGFVYKGKSILDFKNTQGYAKGLDYVPYDEYPAILHKGEAVVPAEYNPKIHSQGNEYTNSLLETMIVKLDDLSNRPNVFEIDGREFANATYPLYRNEENRQNYNAKVSVK